MEQVKCPVAVFVNRQYREGAMVSFVLGGMIDAFLFFVSGEDVAERAFDTSFPL